MGRLISWDEIIGEMIDKGNNHISWEESLRTMKLQDFRVREITRKAREEIKRSKINKESVLEDKERIICKNYDVIDGLRKEIFMEKEVMLRTKKSRSTPNKNGKKTSRSARKKKRSKINGTVGGTINRTEEFGENMESKKFQGEYRAEKREKKRDVVKVDNKKIEEERKNDRVTGPLLDTPPQRVFSELGGISMYQSTKKTNEGYTESGVEEDVERDIITSKKLQKDNVTIEEVVKIINDQRDEMKNVPKMKIPYERYTVLSPPLLGWETSKKNVEALKAVNERFTMIHAGKASHQKVRRGNGMGSDRKESNEGFKMERNSLPRAEWLELDEKNIKSKRKVISEEMEGGRCE
ncbi:10065_t:CDS:2 [Rhizophagus irregularis]|nr:10065_t:CDS:2 [Rhizophagus irregularis]